MVGNGLAPVLAAGDRDRLAAGHGEQPYRGRRSAAATDVDLEVVVLALEPHGKREFSFELAERALDRATLTADALRDTVDHHLRRIDLAVAAHRGIGLLALGMGVERERVAPAEIVPIVDRKRQHDQLLVAEKLAHETIGRRARRAALAGKQLDHRAGIFGRGRRATGESGKRYSEPRADVCTHAKPIEQSL